MTDSATPVRDSRRRPPALAIWSMALVVAPFILVALEINYAAHELSFYSQFIILLVWIASIVVGIIAVLVPLGRWRVAGVLAIVAPAIEAIAILALLVYGFSTI